MEIDIQNFLSHYKGQILIVSEIDELLDYFSDKFIWIGSKIDWSQTLNHKTQKIYKDNNWGGEVRKFIKNNNLECIINKPNSKIYYINDSAIDYALYIDSSISIITDLIDILPQHHYFFDSDINWCLVVSAEGYIDFCKPL